MIITIVECEMCISNYRIPALIQPHEREAPPDWLTVYQGDQLPRDFCSPDCLRAWIIQKDNNKS